MHGDEAGWHVLRARRKSPHHLQVRVSAMRGDGDEHNPYRQVIDATVCHVFRTGSGDDERRIQPGDLISFEIEYAVRRGTSLFERPIGPITVCLEDLESARFLELFLERDLRVPDSQVVPIDGPSTMPRMSLDDPELLRLASLYEWRQRKLRETLRTFARERAFVSRAIREHVADDFEAGHVSVFQYGDTYVARVMLTHDHAHDLGSLRRFVKAERRAGRVPAADERIFCTRGSVKQRIVYERGAAYFLA